MAKIRRPIANLQIDLGVLAGLLGMPKHLSITSVFVPHDIDGIVLRVEGAGLPLVAPGDRISTAAHRVRDVDGRPTIEWVLDTPRD